MNADGSAEVAAWSCFVSSPFQSTLFALKSHRRKMRRVMTSFGLNSPLVVSRIPRCARSRILSAPKTPARSVYDTVTVGEAIGLGSAGADGEAATVAGAAVPVSAIAVLFAGALDGGAGLCIVSELSGAWLEHAEAKIGIAIRLATASTR